MKKVIVIIILCVVVVTVQGQIKIDEVGRVIVGPNTITNLDPSGVLSMSVQGWNVNANYGGSKLAFGDFGSFLNNGWNVFVGEYGTDDSDILWLHGKRGVRMTENNGNSILMEFGCGEDSRVVIRQALRANSMSVLSNDESKSGIMPLDNALARLLQLSSVSYQYVVPRSYTMTPEARSSLSTGEDATRTVCRTDKERADSTRVARLDSIRGAGSTEYGFLTSELEVLFPEVVETDGEGNKYVNYVELIPAVVAALKEQQVAIENLRVQLLECCMRYRDSDDTGASDDGGDTTESKSGAGRFNDLQTTALLYQNVPNPFSAATTIEYYLPQGVADATLYVFTLNGMLMQTHPITARGAGSVTISGSSLSAGMYVYTLVADGQIVDSKRMILTE